MTDPVTLLPRNYTPYEESIEVMGGARLDALGPELIDSVIDPETIPFALLPWLAWQLRVNIWDPGWSEARKRWVVANSIALHRLKGTLAGIKGYLNLVDTTVVDAIVPPAKTFLCPAYSQAERDAFLAMFPQLRVYPYVAGSWFKYADFTSHAFGLNKSFLGAGSNGGSITASLFPMSLGAQERYIRTSVLWDHGVSTKLTTRQVSEEDVGSIQATTYDQVILPAKPKSEFFPNSGPKNKIFFGLPADPSRIVNIPITTEWSFQEARVTEKTISPGLGMIDIVPTDVAQQHQAQAGSLFAGGFIEPTKPPTLPASIAWRNIYQLWYLFDPSRVPISRKRYTHLDWTRLGWPVYTAELQVHISGTINPQETWKFVCGHLRAPSETQTQIDDTLMAVRTAMSKRDQIYVYTTTQRPITPADLRKVGQDKVGDWILAPP
jgi:hypothetical protein